MLDFDGYVANKTIFAASNGYCGFKSIFDKVLTNKTIERIFILKGGPGTGKSSIMKAAIKYANKAGIYAEEILCSSDPYSLDGVILTDGEKSVAIFDGTSPHIMDPIYPGARDEIINLGESFNVSHLKKYRHKIIDFSEKKKECYENAYHYLRLAGEVRAFIDAKYEKIVETDKLDEFVNSILQSFKANEDAENTVYYYISAFCKDGLVRSEARGYENKEVCRLFGNGYTEYLVMNKLLNKLNGKVFAYCPTPLTDKKIEAIHTSDILFITDERDGIDTRVVLRENLNLSEENEIYQSFLTLAKNEFNKAAIHHFALEDIYKNGMHFENNERIFNKLIRDIESELI